VPARVKERRSRQRGSRVLFMISYMLGKLHIPWAWKHSLNLARREKIVEPYSAYQCSLYLETYVLNHHRCGHLPRFWIQPCNCSAGYFPQFSKSFIKIIIYNKVVIQTLPLTREQQMNCSAIFKVALELKLAKVVSSTYDASIVHTCSFRLLISALALLRRKEI
jgi:hypothetical protein